ncbi:hypothetical protein EKL30_13865 [Candidimonas sp. SYP-B2681]|uniref:hypothetical protein n=1 Tax=Candidimonas sp. SYP-B2681 TaxID=2497686 RepID=UPI000F89024F|nr:hypothetical protein [Candidimonas sp. SYP-B2681]RTZ41641.1 hypothetical protein EKL30_13865 [Candidimonas sp. SYP-B2681]
MISKTSSSANGALSGQYEPVRRRAGNPTPSSLAGIRSIGIRSIRDTLSGRRHSKDFAYARGDYLRSRVLVVGIIFAVMTPLWIAIDAMVLPASTLAYTTPGRFFLLAGLIATILLARFGRARITPIRISAGLLIALPAAWSDMDSSPSCWLPHYPFSRSHFLNRHWRGPGCLACTFFRNVWQAHG